MKNIIMIGLAAAAIGGFAAGQEQTTTPQGQQVSFPSQRPSSYGANDIKILGTINSGQTSSVVQTSPKYHALVFEGNGRDVVDISVTGASHQAYVALADSTLTPIASGMGRLETTLPYHGPDTEAFYILIKGSANQRLVVHLKKTPATPRAADSTH